MKTYTKPTLNVIELESAEMLALSIKTNTSPDAPKVDASTSLSETRVWDSANWTEQE